MPLDDTCFTHSKVFHRWKQDDAVLTSNIVSIDLDSGQSTTHVPNRLGQCLAYTFQWVQGVKLNKHYVYKGENQLDAIKMQKSYLEFHPNSYLSNFTLLHLGISPTVYGYYSPPFNPNVAKDWLTKFQKDKNHFVLVVVRKPNWAHIFGIKLDQSTFGGWLNKSYPCSLFDSNVGQGMYNNQSDLSNDLVSIILAYENISTVEFFGLKFDKIN